MPFKRILMAVDTSDIGAHTTLVGLQLASALGAEIAFIHMIGPAVCDGAWYAVASPGLVELPDEEIPQVLAELQGRAPIPKETQRFVPMGDPAPSIAGAARDWAADLVAIGSQGLEGVDRVLLGSVAESLAREAPRPVLIMRK